MANEKDITNNRALETRRDKDNIANFKITLKDIDTAIIEYMGGTLDLSVVQNDKKKISVPVLWGSPERWKAVRRDGVYRDSKGKIQLPLLMVKRNSISRNDNLAMLNRHLQYTAKKTWSQKNKYDKFSVQLRKWPVNEFFNVTMPDYINIFYECVIWTEYVEQMNTLVETINYASDEYWGGSDGRFKFKAKIEDYNQESDISDGTQRNIKTTFQLNITAYLIPENFENRPTTIKTLSPKVLVLKESTVASFDTDESGNISPVSITGAPKQNPIIKNSDSSYLETISNNSDFIINDITIIKLDDTTVTYPAAINLDIGDIETGSLAPVGWDAMVAAYGIGYNFPQSTGQTTIYRTGDDAWVEQNIFTSAVRAVESLKPQNTLASFLVLSNNNTFGNTNRFTDIDGLQVYANDYVIDHYTGLGWNYAGVRNAIWNTAIDDTLSGSLDGYSDYFLPNVMQLMSIRNHFYSDSNHSLKPNSLAWGIIASDDPWTSTTNTNITGQAFCMAEMRSLTSRSKSGEFYNAVIYCRKHY